MMAGLFDPHLPTRVLFVGGGQDSVALLMLCQHDIGFRETFLGKSNFCALMTDTGNEYQETEEYVSWLKQWCPTVGIDFTFVTPDMGFHGATWQSLTDQMERNNNIMGVTFAKSCTDNLKIKVSYRFLAQWLRDHYGYRGNDPSVFYQYRHYFGKLVSWIGFAAGEESRVAHPGPKTPAEPDEYVLFQEGDTGPAYIPKWRKLCVEHRYPLLELGHDRAACQRIIAVYGYPIPYPSNCMFCPFQNEVEIVYLYRTHPDRWQQWVERKAAKLAKFAQSKVNHGVKGKLALPQYLKKALEKYGHWSIEQLREYRFSHGHCVVSKY